MFDRRTEKAGVQYQIIDIMQKVGIKSNYVKANHPAQLEGLFKSGINFILVDDIVVLMPTEESLGIKRIDLVF